MKLIERIRCDESYPWTHRRVYHDFTRDETVCWPVGLHWIARVIRKFWIWTYYSWHPDMLERKCQEAASASYRRIIELQVENVRLRDQIDTLDAAAALEAKLRGHVRDRLTAIALVLGGHDGEDA